ncbi:MAG: LLM class flavin-dependent oxidoreductase [Pseudomonadota bacterium]
MKIGFHIHGTQLPPAAGTTGTAVDHAGADVYRLVRDGMGCDFLLVGGGPVEAASQMGRASQLIVPWGAAALSVSAPHMEIVTRLNAWAFDPAHVARLGANLWALSGRRWSLCLDTHPAFWPRESAGHTPATMAARAREFLDIVLQHWRGRADHTGQYLTSTGRMVGPRPGSTRPKVWLDAALSTGWQSGGIEPDGYISFDGTDRPRSDHVGETMLTCSVVLGRTTGEAQAIASEHRLLAAARFLVGDVESVASQIAALTQDAGFDRIAIGLPTLREAECRLFRDRLVPIVSAAFGKERASS